MSGPAQPIAVPEPVRAWARGRADRVLCLRVDGGVTLTLLLPSETLEARFVDGTAAAAALAADQVAWQPVSPRMAGLADSNKSGRPRRA